MDQVFQTADKQPTGRRFCTWRTSAWWRRAWIWRRGQWWWRAALAAAPSPLPSPAPSPRQATCAPRPYTQQIPGPRPRCCHCHSPSDPLRPPLQPKCQSGLWMEKRANAISDRPVCFSCKGFEDVVEATRVCNLHIALRCAPILLLSQLVVPCVASVQWVTILAVPARMQQLLVSVLCSRWAVSLGLQGPGHRHK